MSDDKVVLRAKIRLASELVSILQAVAEASNLSIAEVLQASLRKGMEFHFGGQGSEEVEVGEATIIEE